MAQLQKLIEKADVLNSQFTNVFTREDLQNVQEFENIEMASQQSSITVTEEILLKYLKSLRIDKTAGPDDAHPFFLNS